MRKLCLVLFLAISTVAVSFAGSPLRADKGMLRSERPFLTSGLPPTIDMPPPIVLNPGEAPNPVLSCHELVLFIRLDRMGPTLNAVVPADESVESISLINLNTGEASFSGGRSFGTKSLRLPGLGEFMIEVRTTKRLYQGYFSLDHLL